VKIHAELTHACGPRVVQPQKFGKDSGRFPRSNYSQRYELCRSSNTVSTLAIIFVRCCKNGREDRYCNTITQLEKDQEEGHRQTYAHTHTTHTHTHAHSPRDTHTHHTHQEAIIYIVAFLLTAPHTLFKLTIYQPNVDKHSVLITSC
jgi:hypothetical protein